MPVPRREDAVVLGQRQRERSTTASAARPRATSSPSCMEKEALDFPGAVERLAGEGRHHPALHRPQRGRGPQEARPATSRRWPGPSTGTTSGCCPGPTPAPARGYLRARGLDGDVVREFRIGWAPDAWDELTRALRLDRRAAPTAPGWRASTAAAGCNDHFRGRILFPISDDRGDPDQLRRPHPARAARAPATRASTRTPPRRRSTTSPRSSTGSTGPRPTSSPPATAVICEGYTDVIGFHRAGVPLAVATCGTALTDDHVRAAHAASRPAGWSWPSTPTAPGQAAAERFYRWEREHDLEVAVADLPAGAGPRRRGARPTPSGWRPRSRARRRSCGSGSTGRSPPPTSPATRAGPGPPSGRSRSWPSTPTELVRDQYVMDVASRCRVEPDRLRTLLEQVRARGPGPAGRAAVAAGAPRRRGPDGAAPAATNRPRPATTGRGPGVARPTGGRGRRQPSRRRRPTTALGTVAAPARAGARWSRPPAATARGRARAATARRSRCCATPSTIPGPSDAGSHVGLFDDAAAPGGATRRCSTPTPTPTPWPIAPPEVADLLARLWSPSPTPNRSTPSGCCTSETARRHIADRAPVGRQGRRRHAGADRSRRCSPASSTGCATPQTAAELGRAVASLADGPGRRRGLTDVPSTLDTWNGIGRSRADQGDRERS